MTSVSPSSASGFAAAPAAASETSTPVVLLVDDEPGVLDAYTILCQRRLSVRTRTCRSAAEALDALDRLTPAVVVTDLAMEYPEAGLDVLRAVCARWPEVPVILMSAVASREAAIAAVNAHAYALLEKPVANDRFEQTLREALQAWSARHRARETATVRSKAARSRRHNHPGARKGGEPSEPRAAGGHLIGEAPAFLEAVALIEQVAPSDVTVLLEGESGVGKGVLASYLHQCSDRRQRPFLSINCGAIAESLLESQLFGHVKGAFTGADREQPGLVRAAAGGTLFLDEVGELSADMQVKLLRVLQEREVIPVGGTEPFTVDVRFVAATNRDLRFMVDAGQFREDLFWRLNVLAVRVPSLRERVEDVPALAIHTLDRIRRRDARVQATRFSPAAVARLQAHQWRGNVRELENAVERAAILAGPEITPDDLPPDLGFTTPDRMRPMAAPGDGIPGLGQGSVLGEPGGLPPLALIERAYVAYVVTQSGHDLQAAARQLGIPLGAIRAILDRSSSSGDALPGS